MKRFAIATIAALLLSCFAADAHATFPRRFRVVRPRIVVRQPIVRQRTVRPRVVVRQPIIAPVQRFRQPLIVQPQYQQPQLFIDQHGRLLFIR